MFIPGYARAFLNLKNKMKKIIILSGPSWVGKTTIWQKFKEKYPNFPIEKIITTTTRNPRPNEIDWKDYYFVSLDKFKDLIQNHQLIEYAEVHNNFYGSTYDELERILNSGKSALYIVDPQWVKFLKSKLSSLYDVKTIFILPPSIEELKNRLLKRWEDPNSESYKIRVNESLVWLAEKDDYDFQIVNDNLDKAVEEFKNIVSKE